MLLNFCLNIFANFESTKEIYIRLHICFDKEKNIIFAGSFILPPTTLQKIYVCCCPYLRRQGIDNYPTVIYTLEKNYIFPKLFSYIPL